MSMDHPEATRSHPYLTLLTIWLAWALTLGVLQAAVVQRFSLQRPDAVLSWTANETGLGSHRTQPYLLGRFLSEHVAWDSEFYLSIALAGYDDPSLRALMRDGPPGLTVIPASGQQVTPGWGPPNPDFKVAGIAQGEDPARFVSLNYAFFPLYPMAMRALAGILAPLGLGALPTATLAGCLLAMLGALVAMLALFDLTREWLGDEGGLRAAFYLLIFPTGFFLAQVYTEGLFVGLAFASLALMARRRIVLAALLAVLATWTRAVGVALVVPLALALFEERRSLAGMATAGLEKAEPGAAALGLVAPSFRPPALPALSETARLVLHGLCAAAPAAAFAVWRLSALGDNFQFVEERFFGRGALQIGKSLSAWIETLQALSGGNPQTAVYYGLETFTVILALVACLATMRWFPGPACFGLLVWLISVSSGAPQSLSRYMLAVPSIFIGLAALGRARAFDRGWTLASVSVMAVLTALFSFDFWVA